jgi:general secretion pathway protein J
MVWRSVTPAQAAAKLKLADANATARMGALLAGDLAQVVPRPPRNARGDREPAFRGGEGALLLSYVRTGSERVELRLTDQRIERLVFRPVDAVSPLAPMILAEGVGAVRLRFRLKGEWLDRWQQSNRATLPQAVELTITRPGEAALTRLFMVGAGA